MWRNLVFLGLVGSLLAFPSRDGPRTEEDVQELKEFLLKTKQDDTPLEDKMAQSPYSNAWENSGKFQGDIMLMDEEIEEMLAEYADNSTTGRTALSNTRHRWPGGVIIYDIAANTFNAAQLDMIQRGLNFFHETTCTRWQRRTNQNDYVLITGRNDGCYATVGYWQWGGVHTLNLAPNGCFNLMIVIHEMLHSAGFHHMHQAYSRNNYVTIHFENVVRGMEHNFDMFSNQVINMMGLPYEYASNQHYGATAFSSNGRPTIVARFSTNQMGQLTHVTGYDIWRLARAYNCPGAWRVNVREEDANKPYTEEFVKMLKDAAEEELKERAAMLDKALEERKQEVEQPLLIEGNAGEKVIVVD